MYPVISSFLHYQTFLFAMHLTHFIELLLHCTCRYYPGKKYIFYRYEVRLCTRSIIYMKVNMNRYNGQNRKICIIRVLHCFVTFCVSWMFYCMIKISIKFILLYTWVHAVFSILPLLSSGGRHIIEAFTGSCRWIRWFKMLPIFISLQ